ncbi:hypothetical protein ABZY05_42760 [Streptomyces canus]|uniref:hypothetical protein n=1 Tax=Streptomyces canus TaxID=58343 RepID=UPI0033B35F2A
MADGVSGDGSAGGLRRRGGMAPSAGRLRQRRGGMGSFDGPTNGGAASSANGTGKEWLRWLTA